jgi:hypothetical protein
MKKFANIVYVLFVIAVYITININVLYAAILLNVPQFLMQPDGTKIHCYTSGDEYNHWFHTDEQYIIKQNPTTGYYFVSNEKITDIEITGEYINIAPYKKKYNQDLFQSDTTNNNKGNLTNIVVFVRFSDDTEYNTNISFSFYDSLFNFTQGASLYGYFKEMSYQQLEVRSHFFPLPQNNQVRSFQLQHRRNYYIQHHPVTNPEGYADNAEAQKRRSAMLQDILKYLNGVVPKNLKLDGNKQGTVDNVSIIFKGLTDARGNIL